MKKLLFLVAILAFFSCEEKNSSDTNTSIIGYWANPEIINDSITGFERKDQLETDEGGFHFMQDTLIERTSGWCGTPPLSFFDIKHLYDYNDSIIVIKTIDKQDTLQLWKVKKLTSEELYVIRNFLILHH